MNIRHIITQLKLFYREHGKLIHVVLIFLGVYILLNGIGIFYKPLSPKELLRKENADAVKAFILNLGIIAPVFFVIIQIAQVIILPIPGQVVGFAAGYIFGWKLGTIYTMIGLTGGSFIVFELSKIYGRPVVERLHGAKALRDLEKIFFTRQQPVVTRQQDANSYRHSPLLLTFFLIMLLPGFPDNLICFAAGLTPIPVRKLMMAVVFGRFPSALVLTLLGDGWASAERNSAIYFISLGALLLTGIYLLMRPKVEKIIANSPFF